MTKPNANIQLITSKYVFRDGPSLAERTNDSSDVSDECHDPPEEEGVVELYFLTAL